MSALRTLVEAWPALLSEEMAARYLSLELTSFRRVAVRHHLQSVALEENSVRWRKTDLDQLVRRLRSVPTESLEYSRAGLARLNDVDIERIAVAVARHLEGRASHPVPTLVSIKDACALLGLARTTIYRLIKEGELVPCRIGRRTLIPMTQVQAIQKGSA